MSANLTVGRLRAIFEAVGAKELGQDISKVKTEFEQAGTTGKKAGKDIDDGTAKGAEGAKKLSAEAAAASKSTEVLGANAKAAGKDQEEAAGKTKSLTKELVDNEGAASAVGTAMVGMGVAVAAGIGVAVAKYSDFSSKMAQFQSLSHASVGEMDQMTTAALKSGTAVGFSASEVADAEIEMTKAGIGVSDMLGGALSGSLNLAAAGQIDVGDATSYATIAMTQFGLKGKDIPHLADLMAAGADKALGSVGDLGEALSNGGLQASAMGMSIEETIGTLSAFANSGLIGAEAGTQLKSMFNALLTPSLKAKNMMDDYGISLYDTSGKFVGMAGLAGQLQKGLSGVDDATRSAALSTIFGSYAVNAANILYTQGADGIQAWTDSVNESGFAAEQAEGKMNSLQGDTTKLGAAFDTTFIQVGSGANDVLRGMVQTLTNVVSWVGDLPTPVLNSSLAIGGLVAGLLLLGGTFLIAVPKVAEFKSAMEKLDVSGKSIWKTFGKGGLILTALTIFGEGAASAGTKVSLSESALAQFNAQIKNFDISKINESFKTDQFDGFSNALNKLYTSNFFESNQPWNAAAKGIDGITFGLTNLGAQFDSAKGKFAAMDAKIATMDFSSGLDQVRKLGKEAGGTEDSYRELLSAFPTFKKALIEQADAAGLATDDQSLLNILLGKTALNAADATAKTKENSAALKVMAGQAADTADDVDKLADKIRDFGKTTLDLREANRGMEAAFDDLSDSVKKNGVSLDITTEKGRSNQAAIDDVTKSTLDFAAATYTQTGSQEQASAVLANGRTRLVEMLAQFGITGQAAEDYANSLGLIPSNITQIVKLLGADVAKAQLEDLVRDRMARINVKFVDDGTKGALTYNAVRAYAQGALISPAHFASGTENHVAQIAPAGALRLWAEPETGGEAYIPLAASKRARSEMILAAVAERFGMQIISKRALAFADGALVPSVASITGTTNAQPAAGTEVSPGVTVGPIIVQTYPGEDLETLAERVAKAIERKLK